MNNTKQKGMGKDFYLVIIGQIISLFGNNILRYAMPLYLLNITGSAIIYSVTMAASFIPMLLFAPVGGIIADRVNKRNIMVILDFITSILVLGYFLIFSHVNIIVITIVFLMFLYGIQGLYQPTVQASVPLLVDNNMLTTGNALINMVGSLAGILGPVIGGVIFVKYGVDFILKIAVVCFLFSAIMELFIYIPYEKQKRDVSAVKVAKDDMKLGLKFITKQKPIIGKLGVILLLVNAVFSALIIVGLPVIVNQTLGFESDYANTLYGYAQGALAVGGLVGGIIAGVFGNKLKVNKGALFLFMCTLSIFPIGLVLTLKVPSMVAYVVILTCCFAMMALSTIITILLITYVQTVTDKNLLGKIMAILTCMVMCGHPIGQLVYGFFLEKFSKNIDMIFYVAFALAFFITLISRKLFKKID